MITDEALLKKSKIKPLKCEFMNCRKPATNKKGKYYICDKCLLVVLKNVIISKDQEIKSLKQKLKNS